MTLAWMIAIDENALACDLAETYHIFDFRQLPPDKVAVFAVGLKNDSRIKRKMRNDELDTETTLLAMIADRIGTVAWLNSADGAKGVNRPKSILEHLAGPKEQQAQDGVVAYESGEEFERAREAILRGG